jgi:hypothetical protein
VELIDVVSRDDSYITVSPSVRSFLFWVSPEVTGSYWQTWYLGKAEVRSWRVIETGIPSMGEKFGFPRGENHGIN